MSIIERAADKARETKTNTTSNQRHKTVDFERAGQNRSPGREASVEVPPLQIDFKALHKAEVMPPPSMEEAITNEYRRVKRPLIANITGRGVTSVADGQCIMVSSALQGEGKTFTSVNLAFSLARERDTSLLLVDGDIKKPRISLALGIQDRPGLMDVLADEEVSAQSAIIPTDTTGLSVMPAGRNRDNANELLSSRRMDRLLEELCREPGRIVLFDSPPLLATAEAQALAVSMGQIVLVVKAGATENKALEAALALLDPAKAINLLLNQRRRVHGDRYGGYYGGYYGGQYGSD